MNSVIPVVLPIYNQERILSSIAWSVLDLADSMQTSVRLILVDDGSTDDSFHVACELSRTVPQVEVFRQSSRLGLKAAVERVRRDADVTSAIIHDGASPIDLGELAALLKEASAGDRSATSHGGSIDGPSRGSRRFASVRALSERMQQAHGAITAFSWMRGNELHTSTRTSAGSAAAAPALFDGLSIDPHAANSPLSAN